MGNAAARAVPHNHLQFDIAPLDFSWETIVTGERLVTLMNHELVHVATTDQAAPSDRFFRELFRGKVFPEPDHPESILYLYLTAPRTTVPRWYLEGVAVFSETWMAGGIGRAQGSYDEMVFRSMVRDGSHFYDPLGLVAEGTQIDFQIETHSYLYGTRFVSYLVYHYGPRELVRWVSRVEGTKRSYLAQFREVFGIPLRQAWQDWIDFEQEFQRANLERIRAYPTTPYEDLSDRPLGFVSRGHFDPDTNQLYAGLNYQGAVSHIAAISLDDGSVERIIDVKGPAIYSVTSTAYDPVSRTIFYTTDQGAFRDLRALDLETERARTLIKDARIGDLALNAADRSLWGIRHLSGIATLVRIPAP